MEQKWDSPKKVFFITVGFIVIAVGIAAVAVGIFETPWLRKGAMICIGLVGIWLGWRLVRAVTKDLYEAVNWLIEFFFR